MSWQVSDSDHQCHSVCEAHSRCGTTCRQDLMSALHRFSCNSAPLLADLHVTGHSWHGGLVIWVDRE